MKKCASQQWEDNRTIFCASTNDPWKMNKSTAVINSVTYQSPRFLVLYCVFTSICFNTKFLKLQNKLFILPKVCCDRQETNIQLSSQLGTRMDRTFQYSQLS